MPAPTPANAAIRLAFTTLSGATVGGYAPEYTHQFFGQDEELRGYVGVRATLSLPCNPGYAAPAAPGAQPLPAGGRLRVRWDERRPGADDIPALAAEGIPAGCVVEQGAAEEGEGAEGGDGSAAPPFLPPGTLLGSYEAKGSPTGATAATTAAAAAAAAAAPAAPAALVQVWRARLSDPAMRAQFEGALQPLFFWYIDGASAIDAADGERWEVYAAYEVLRRGEGGEGGQGGDDEAEEATTARPRALVGFATVFTFQTPFQGERARVCQVLVLPPYQGRGHGAGLLRAINGSLRARGDKLSLITVEDPAPAFRRLRTRVDLADVAALGLFFGRPADDDGGGDGDDAAAAASAAAAAAAAAAASFAAARPSDAAVGAVRAALKITERQVQLCYEGLRLRHGVDRSDEAAYKVYRLDVKRRLLADCADEIEEAMRAACADEELDRASPEGAVLAKVARKEWLDRRYKEVEAAYDAALRHLA